MTTSTPKGIAIGSTVGIVACGVVSLVLLARSHHFYMATGSELEMVLPQAVTLAGVYCGLGRQISKSSFLCSLRRPVGITHGG